MSDRRDHNGVLAGLASLAVGAGMAGIVTLLSHTSGAYALPDRSSHDITTTDPSAPPVIAPGAAGTTVLAGTISASLVPTTTTPPPPPAPTTPPPTTTKTKTPSPDQRTASQVIGIVNTERAWAGCPPVVADSRLDQAAQAHSSDMSANNYFSHTSQDGRTFVDRAKAAGYPSPAAENIARGQRTAQQVMQAWMNSPGHRANILNCGHRTMGIGLDANGYYWTQIFGR